MSFAVLAADCLAPSFCNSDYDCLFTFSYMEVGCRSDSKRSSPQQCKGCISVVTEQQVSFTVALQGIAVTWCVLVLIQRQPTANQAL